MQSEDCFVKGQRWRRKIED